MTSPWAAPPVPRLPGSGHPVRLFDTAAGELVAANPQGTARMYVCGITPYDATHLGHAATYVAFDLLNRVWRDTGLEVRYVQNVTDVDDPLLERAAATGVDWQELAADQTALFHTDMVALRVLPPDEYIGAVEGIPLVVNAVEKLLAAGYAYTVPGNAEHPDGDVYFSVHADPTFGSIAHLDETRMRQVFAERGGDPDRPGKKHPLDCLLWRAARPGEPSWEGAGLGRGRPGWHIECTTIALAHLGSAFDVQGGGSDLAFPHHEMGAAEGHLLTGSTPYAQTYVHSGMVGLDGRKMSKSLGNLVLVSKLRAAGHEPVAVRLAILAHHYRSDWDWTAAGLTEAEGRLARWRAAVAMAGARPVGGESDLLEQVRERLSDDLDAPGALAAVDAWADRQLASAGRPDPSPAARPAGHRPEGHRADAVEPDLVVRLLDALLGVRI